MHAIDVYIFKDKDIQVPGKVSLPQGFAMIWADETRKEWLISQCDAMVHAETDYFGGAGEQSATVFRGNTFTPCESINQALRIVGVEREDGHDEFDTIHLGKYRSSKSFPKK